MKNTSFLPVSIGLLLISTAASRAQAIEQPDPKIERGQYLAHRSALCIDCHSPRDETGQFIAAQHLTGSLIGFTPTVPMPWAPAAPSLIGLEGYTAEQAIKFLMTGERPSGVPPRAPMPEYRFDKADAEAIVAYLQSLKPKL